MDTTAQIPEQEKNALYKKIADIMLTELKTGSLSSEDVEDISFFTLENLDNATNSSYLEAFTEELAKRWPSFTPLAHPIKQQESIQKDQKNIEAITSEIKNLS